MNNIKSRPTGRPTAEELLLADAFLRMRLEVSSSWSSGLVRLVDDALRQICRCVWKHTGGMVVASSFTFGGSPVMRLEIDAILHWLRDAIHSLLESKLETLTDEDMDEGKASEMEADLVDIVSHLRDETESRMAAYFYIGMTEAEMSGRLRGWKRKPWGDPLWVAAVLALGGRASASYFDPKRMPTSRGRSNVSFNKLRLYGETSMQEESLREMLAAAGDPKWFISLTADETACGFCKEEEGNGWQPISQYSGPWHPYCRCRFVFR